MDEADFALERRAARHFEDPRRRSHGDRDLRLPRRGAALDRLGVAARNPHPLGGARMALRLVVEDGIKGAIEPCARRPAPGRGARSVRGYAGALSLESDRAEAQRSDIVRRLAMATPRPALRSRAASARALTGRLGAGEAGGPSGCARRSGMSSPPIRSMSMRAATAYGSWAGSAFRPSAGRTRASSSSSSTAARCATRRWRARCAGPTSISCRPTGTRSWRCSSIGPERSRRQRPSGQGRGALSRFGPDPRPDRRRDQAASNQRCTALRPPAERRRFSRCGRRNRSGPRPSGGWDWRASPAAPRLTTRRNRASPRPRRRRPGDGCAGAGARPRRAARRRAGAGARDLHHRPDPRTGS